MCKSDPSEMKRASGEVDAYAYVNLTVAAATLATPEDRAWLAQELLTQRALWQTLDDARAEGQEPLDSFDARWHD